MLIFTRRAYDAPRHRFTNNPSSLTRYLSVSASQAAAGQWSGHIIDRAAWLDKVRVAMGGSNEILIYIHGFNTSQVSMLQRLETVESGLRAKGFAGAIVAYDWPSDGSILRYVSDRNDAKTVAPYLVTDGIEPLLTLSPKPKLHILAHSMGTYLTLRAFAAFGDSSGPGATPWKIDQVLFSAADSDSAWYERGAWGALVLKHRANRLTNYYSPLDDVLAMSRNVYNGNRARAGRAGLPPPVYPQHIDVYGAEQYRRHVPPADRDVMVSHNWWYENDGWLRDAALTLAGHDAATMPTRQPTNIADQALLTP